MRYSILLPIALTLIGIAAATEEAIPLYEGPAPGTEDWTHDEKEYYSQLLRIDVVTNVSKPTITPFLPDPDKANGTAVVIAPGGGFHILSIDSEGTEVAEWLNEKGVACFVLKYRLIPTGEDGVMDMMKKAQDTEKIVAEMSAMAPMSGADGLAAMRYVRENAEKFGVNPNRIGFMGFSAGGAVTAHVALNYDELSKPNFVAPVYGALSGYMSLDVPSDAPPAFVIAATDDPLDLAKDSIDFYEKWREAKKPVELHMYSKGGHGFGMKTQGLPSDQWIDRFGDWLAVQGLLTPKGE